MRTLLLRVGGNITHEWQLFANPALHIAAIVISNDDGGRRHNIVYASKLNTFTAVDVKDSYAPLVHIMLLLQIMQKNLNLPGMFRIWSIQHKHFHSA